LNMRMLSVLDSRFRGNDNDVHSISPGLVSRPKKENRGVMKHSYRTLFVAMLGLIPLCIPSSVGAQGCPAFYSAQITGYAPPELVADSGVVASRRNPDVLWIINDISGQPYVYAVHQNGRLLGRYALTGAESRNYEDIALGPGPIRGMDYLYIGDIGDNAENNKHAFVYRTLEPAVDPNQAAVDIVLPAVDKIKLSYPNNGSRDAETLMVDTNGDLYIVTKRTDPAQIFLAPFPQSTTGDNLMHYLGSLLEDWKIPPGEPYHKGPTGGDISPSGGKILIRGYWAAYLWERNENESIGQALSRPGCPVPLSPNESHGEGIGFDPQGQGYYTTSEGEIFQPSQPIYYFLRQSHIADINSDGIVDLLDLAILSAQWEKSRCYTCHGADLTGDGAVNLDDLAVFVNDWMLP